MSASFIKTVENLRSAAIKECMSPTMTGTDTSTRTGVSGECSITGFNVVLGVDIDKDASTTLKNNSKNMKVVTSDVRCLDPEEVTSEAGFGVNEIDIAAGGSMIL